MTKPLLLKDLEHLKEDLQDKLLAGLVEELNFEPSPESLHRLEEAIAAFESERGMTSEKMLEKFDCDDFEADPELGRWAALYCSYKELKESA